jgi:hypothetical protein
VPPRFKSDQDCIKKGRRRNKDRARVVGDALADGSKAKVHLIRPA